MIDIVRDYAAIGVGTAQASTSRAMGGVRASASRVGSLANLELESVANLVAAIPPVAALGRAREAAPHGLELDQVISRLGLVKASELNAVRHRLQRLERRLGDVRGER